MDKIFLTLLNMSINATYIAIAVILLRLILKKSPRWIHCLLWAFVGIRLVFPNVFESRLSVIPSTEPIPIDTVEFTAPPINNEGIYFNQQDIPTTPIDITAAVDNAGSSQILTVTHIASIIWIVGIILLLAYTVISYLRLNNRVKINMEISRNVYICDEISSPFILGVFKPQIFIPSSMGEDERESVLLHERAHIRRFDHLWKPIAYLLLSVYWYNPILWLAYVLLCRDIELACDESVIKNLSAEDKKKYSTVLLNASCERRLIAACPLAFGEVGVKSRIKSILNYKKPGFWIILLSLIVCIAVSVFLLTDPKKEESEENGFEGIEDITYFSELDDTSLKLIEADLYSENPTVKIEVTTSNEKTLIFGEEFHVYRYLDGEWINCSRTDDTIWTLLAFFASHNQVMRHTYSLRMHDLSNVGRYKFVTDFLIDKEGPDKDGKFPEYEIGFEFTLTKVVELIKPSKLFYDFTEGLTLTYKSSPDPITPAITLNRLNNTYMFTHSAFSSYIDIGEYKLYINRLELDSYDMTRHYVLDRVENGFAFNEALSSSIPKYSYKAGEPAQTPVPDGAVFEGEFSTSFVSMIYDDIWFDGDGDGIDEYYSISVGYTSGLFSFILHLSEGDYKTSATFYTDCADLRFSTSEENGLCINTIEENGVITTLDVIFDGERISIPQMDNENPQTVQTVIESYATVKEIHDDYIVVTEGDNGHIHTNDATLESKTEFIFYVYNPNDFRVGYDVIIYHDGIFDNDTELPSAVPSHVKVVNIAEDDKPNTVKVNHGYIEEVSDEGFYIIVNKGEGGYIHTNDSSLAQETRFKFSTLNFDLDFSVGDKVSIAHTGEFVMDGIPCGTPLSIDIIS